MSSSSSRTKGGKRKSSSSSSGGSEYMDEMKKTLDFCAKAKKAGTVSNVSNVQEVRNVSKHVGNKQTGKARAVTPPKSNLKIKRGRLNATNSPGSRYLSSLGVLTKNFVELLQNTDQGAIDLNKAAELLGVQKRRIYDITNVLEGINLIEKKPKGNIFWLGSGDLDPDAEKKMLELEAEIVKLTAQEQVLELDLHHMISAVKKQMLDESFKKKAFITLNDVKILKCFQEATVMAIKAPMGTTLEVPDPDSFEGENGQRRYNIYLKSLYGPIDVFLVSSGNENQEEGGENDTNESKRKSRTSTTTPSKRGSNRKRRKRSHSMNSMSDIASPGKGSGDIAIPSPIKLGSNQTPLKLGSLSPFFPRAFMGGPTNETPMSDAPIVSDDRLIQLLPAFNSSHGYGMAIMDDSEGISDLFSPKHSFDPVVDTNLLVMDEEDIAVALPSSGDKKRTKAQKKSATKKIRAPRKKR